MELGWMVALALVSFDVFLWVSSVFWNKRNMKAIVADIWNDRIELEDLNGEVIKVPVTKIVKDKDGNEVEKVDMVVAPLWYTILYGAGSMAATQVKMSLLSAKGKVSRQLNTMALAGEAQFSPATLAAIEMLPNKYKGVALMIAQYLGSGTKQAETGPQVVQRGTKPI